ncbi:phosphomevalonate kinase, peroxisomal [Phalaenopsis equestris]|uniref:phosphomevalonate kinase, peroxisomal n=1 Tax=Phalaenopsis equestris TaxID=78828 RepID=UPI0009E3BEDC|nr:phosphomevalonate kinase, peroxisomal [Phalaenopsis equestris]XP_020582927.1 phosphomevalonate kinase, peroxisomal [Phalaenopsis equestris]
MEVVASAPGKVLITGGYLVLDRPNSGLVLSTNARFYAIVKPLYEEIEPKSWAWSWTDVKVSSPQLHREATYKLSLKKSTLQCTTSRNSVNPFVEYAVQYAVAAAREIFVEKEKKDVLQKLLLQGLDITILGSNAFYSYRRQIEARGLPLTKETLATLPSFSSITFNVEDSNGAVSGSFKPEVAKTGLGSSAAMTTSVVAALLHYFGLVKLPSSSNCLTEQEAAVSNIDMVHIIAQSAHCLAQGKIGSGFDVSASVYGSQRYVRFSPSVLSSAQVEGNYLPDVISEILNAKWDHEASRFCLPPLMTLLLGEHGSGGSSTPSMVGSVKQWKNSDPKNSLETWTRLANANAKLEALLNSLNKYAREQWAIYKHIMETCSSCAHGKWLEQAVDHYQEEIVKSLLGARDTFFEIRFLLQQMGKAAGVPIEPVSQTQLLDATMNMNGVLLAGVPGAGGFDAIFAIIVGEATGGVAKAWSSAGVLPLLVWEDPRGVALEEGDPRSRELSSAMSSVNIY